MDIKDISKAGPACALSDAVALSGVPEVSDEVLAAALSQSHSCKHLCHFIDGRIGAGRALSRDEVSEILTRATLKDGRANPNHAVVLAYYAQRHGHIFAPDSHQLLARFLAKVDWAQLMFELEALVDKLQREAQEAARQREIERERLEDDVIKPEERKRALLKDNGTVEDRQRDLRTAEQTKADARVRLRDASEADVDEELTGSGKLKLTDVQLAKLMMLKKGFAQR